MVDVVDTALSMVSVYLHVVGAVVGAMVSAMVDAEFRAPKITLHLETNSIL